MSYPKNAHQIEINESGWNTTIIYSIAIILLCCSSCGTEKSQTSGNESTGGTYSDSTGDTGGTGGQGTIIQGSGGQEGTAGQGGGGSGDVASGGNTGDTDAGKPDSTIQGECGNGVIDANEDCDGTNLGGATCETLNNTGGTLNCTQTCLYDLSMCRDDDSSSGGYGATGGIGGTTAGAGGQGGTAGTINNDPCTPSQPVSSARASGSGPHQVTVETNSDPGINEGTIFRPTDLGGAEKYPIYAWGNGGCSQMGLSNQAALSEIASHGYFVIADGTPTGGSGNRSMGGDPASMGRPLLAYIEWAMAENDKPCSAYYQSLDTTKTATNGFSCGGLMAEGTAGDPRITTWGFNSSGLFAANPTFYQTIHTPVLMVQGGPSDIAYANGKRDYENISPLGFPIMFFSKDIGHGGDLFRGNGDFVKIDLAWLNWWLKGDEGATGKGVLVGSSCTYCSDPAWEVMSANLP